MIIFPNLSERHTESLNMWLSVMQLIRRDNWPLEFVRQKNEITRIGKRGLEKTYKVDQQHPGHFIFHTTRPSMRATLEDLLERNKVPELQATAVLNWFDSMPGAFYRFHQATNITKSSREYYHGLASHCSARARKEGVASLSYGFFPLKGDTWVLQDINGALKDPERGVSAVAFDRRRACMGGHIVQTPEKPVPGSHKPWAQHDLIVITDDTPPTEVQLTELTNAATLTFSPFVWWKARVYNQRTGERSDTPQWVLELRPSYSSRGMRILDAFRHKPTP